jgi:hemerythrin
MERWAAEIPSVAFICICCAGPALAFSFRDRLRLQSCFNCFLVSEKYLPTWGQLGCSGFVILDSDLRVVCPATSAYLDHQASAFRDVETRLHSLLLGRSVQDPVDDDESRHSYEKGRPSGGNCVSGSCTLPIAGGRSCKNEIAPEAVHPLGKIQPTGVAAMDEEHEECSRLLEDLREKRSKDALAAVLRCLQTHFAHEEQMLDESLYSSVAKHKPSHTGSKRKPEAEILARRNVEDAEEATGGSFSAEAGARKSHFADHARMLNNVRNFLDDDAHSGRLVSEAFINGLLRDFEAHASRYDDAYRGFSSSQLLRGM